MISEINISCSQKLQDKKLEDTNNEVKCFAQGKSITDQTLEFTNLLLLVIFTFSGTILFFLIMARLF